MRRYIKRNPCPVKVDAAFNDWVKSSGLSMREFTSRIVSNKNTVGNFLFKNKRGSILDTVGLIAAFIVFLVVVVVIFIATSSVNDAFVSMNQTQNEVVGETASEINQNTKRYPAFWDFLLVLLFFGMWIITFVSAYLLGNHPIFLWIYILGSFALVIGAFVLQSFLQNFRDAAAIAPFMDSFPMTSWLITNFGIMSILVIISVGVGLYMKPSGSE